MRNKKDMIYSIPIVTVHIEFNIIEKVTNKQMNKQTK